jgi:hypothetical protein
MTIYPVEFHRRLEQKWATRVDQILTVTRNATPPRDPNDDDEEDEEKDDTTKTRPTNRRSCGNRMKISLAPGYRCGDPCRGSCETLVIARRLWEASFVRWRWLISAR